MEKDTETITRISVEDQINNLKGILLQITSHLIEGNSLAAQITERPPTTSDWLFMNIEFCTLLADTISKQTNQLGYHCNKKDDG